ncbi:PREDICTED: protein NETWORKED 1C-like isoform X1 [Camelina sativa]|uniref:Protein NETWORKED 1C-like isoform X1 n=1 Tax=Camelina sativa TaxID=90675 RepID=A0ABM0TRA8_CAMSA|nr:PREDICTED: protein NETWORKED 1C-like isoform X1 [Camelina sativa]
MEIAAKSNSKPMYSWWWDSHNTPKNSKWLQENLAGMDNNVKQMIKVLEEDADSFARRAEMYYRKRPELMKLVEEFYRAYRALAERYNHATGVIHKAHQTISEACPSQVPLIFGDESSHVTNDVDPQTPEMHPPFRARVGPDGLLKDVKRNIDFSEEAPFVSSGKARKGLNFNDVDGKGRNDLKERASKAEAELVALRDSLSTMQAEKEASLAQFEENLERLSNLESEVSRAQEDSRGLRDTAASAEAEIQTLRETLYKLESEKESSLLRYEECLQKIADLEDGLSVAHKEAEGMNERASKAEAEILALKQSLAKAETEKEAALVQYRQCLNTISNLEERLRKAEEGTRLINERAEKAGVEVENLKQTISNLIKEKEASELQFQQCLNIIADLKVKLHHAQEETQSLSHEIEDGVAKLKFSEEKCLVLERSNQNLHSELDGLLEKLGNQSQMFTEKQTELVKLWSCVQEEHLRFQEAETAFQTLQQLHSQSQEELNNLAVELQTRSQIMKDMEIRNSELHEEIELAKVENKGLNELNLSSVASIKSLQEDVSSLKEIIRKLEADVELRVNQRNALQQEIYCLKEELSQVGKKNQSMVEQVELVGSSVKELQEETSTLKECNERVKSEKMTLSEKLATMEKLAQKNLMLEKSISDLNFELKSIRSKLKTLEEACQSLSEEKSGLISENEQTAIENIVLIEWLQQLKLEAVGIETEKKNLEGKANKIGDKLIDAETENMQLKRNLLFIRSDKDHLEDEIANVKDHLHEKEKELEEIKREKEKLNQEVFKEMRKAEFWESQAATFFCDKQIAAVHETLIEATTRELAEACKNLESKSASKDAVIEMLKRSQAIVLLNKSIKSLEDYVFVRRESEGEISKGTDSVDELPKLEDMCLRIKAVAEAVMEKEKLLILENTNAYSMLEASLKQIKELKTGGTGRSMRKQEGGNGKMRKQSHEIEMEMKDIVLDQTSDGSSYEIVSKKGTMDLDHHGFVELKPVKTHKTGTVARIAKGKSLSEESLVVDKVEIFDGFMDPNTEINKRKVVERLGSDLQNLENLQITVEVLKSKVDAVEKEKMKVGENEYETIKGQLEEADEAIEKLFNVNRKLTTKAESEKDIDRSRRISEQARRGSEKIVRLQQEIQRIQFLLMKLEGEREHRTRTKVSDTKSKVLLRDYIYGGSRSVTMKKRTKKRSAFCGCVQQPQSP